MKDTARSSGSLFMQGPSLGWFVMSIFHSTGIFDVQETFYQAVCSCGWLSTTSFLEEVDLLRALHAHQMTVFDQVEAERVLSEVSLTLKQDSLEANGE